MSTFTTLAESKCAAPDSEQDTPTVGASTTSATESPLARRAAAMSLASWAASAGCDRDVQVTVVAGVTAELPAAKAGAAGTSRVAPSIVPAAVMESAGRPLRRRRSCR
jgi:hypothetical protein